MVFVIGTPSENLKGQTLTLVGVNRLRVVFQEFWIHHKTPFIRTKRTTSF